MVFWGVGVVFFGGSIPGLPHGGVVDNFGSAAEPGWISRRSKVDQPPILKEAPARASEGKQERGTRARPQHNGRETTEAHGGGHGGARRWRGDNHKDHKGLNGERGRGPRRTGWTTRRNRRLRRLRQIWGSAAADRTARGEDHGGHEGGWRTITADTKDTKEGADSRGLWRVAGGEGFCYTISPVLRQVAVIVWEGRRPCSVRTSRRCSSSVRGPL